MISVLTPSIRPEFLHITQECLENQTFQDFEWIVEIGLRHRGFTLPSDMNKMLKRAKGDRIVSLQDCIQILPNALEKIHALPNQMYTFPVGQVTSFGEIPVWDWRDEYKFEGDVTPNLWEADFACGPTKAFFEVGGYDETFESGWSWDNVEVAWRIERAGYKFYCDRSIRGIALKHDSIKEHPFRMTRELNGNRAEETRKKASYGEFKLNYLS